MSKELEALRKLLCDWESLSVDERCECANVIEGKLKRVEMVEHNFKVINEQFDALFMISCKESYALKIIKKKQVNVSALLELKDLKLYNDYCDMVGNKHLTKKEYELLKEVLL